MRKEQKEAHKRLLKLLPSRIVGEAPPKGRVKRLYRGKTSPRPVIVNGREYRSTHDAARSVGVPQFTLRRYAGLGLNGMRFT